MIVKANVFVQQPSCMIRKIARHDCTSSLCPQCCCSRFSAACSMRFTDTKRKTLMMTGVLRCFIELINDINIHIKRLLWCFSLNLFGFFFFHCQIPFASLNLLVKPIVIENRLYCGHTHQMHALQF